MRKFYQWILAAHPKAFRDRFEIEMLCVFDEALATEGAFRLITDGMLSLFRQLLFKRRPARDAMQAAAAGPSLFRSVVSDPLLAPSRISCLAKHCDTGPFLRPAGNRLRSSGQACAAATISLCEAV